MIYVEINPPAPPFKKGESFYERIEENTVYTGDLVTLCFRHIILVIFLRTRGGPGRQEYVSLIEFFPDSFNNHIYFFNAFNVGFFNIDTHYFLMHHSSFKPGVIHN